MNQQIALQCTRLRKQYGKNTVLNDLNLTVAAGNIHGLVGLNGTGKTTTIECVLGLRTRNNGDISILGFSPENLYTAQGKVAVVFDSPCLHPQLTVTQCLQYARLHAPQTALAISEVIQLLGIERYQNFKVKELSLGNRRRTAIAQALIHRPHFVILDEPFNGLDAGGVDDVLNLIQRLNKTEGASFLLASHQLAYLERICTHVAIMAQGQVCQNEKLETLLQDEQHEVSIITNNSDAAKTLIKELPGIELIEPDTHATKNEFASDAKHIRCRLHKLSSGQLNAKLVHAGIEVEQLMLHKPSLESVFYQAVGGRA